MIIGSHVSFSGPKGLVGSVLQTIENGGNALMIYTGPPQNTSRKQLNQNNIKEALELMREHHIMQSAFVIHAPYIINLATDDESKQKFARSFLKQEVERTAQLGSNVIVVHPGNALGLPLEKAILNISTMINKVIEATPESGVVITLEILSGKGSEVGKNFSELKAIIDLINNKERIGVCLDTCHMHDSGYDIINNYKAIKKEFMDIIGLNYLKVIHINDSKNKCGDKKDRHENIGMGQIGLNPILEFCYDEDFKYIPKILETPYIDDISPYKKEIEYILSNHNFKNKEK